jgi:hypothetical protein
MIHIILKTWLMDTSIMEDIVDSNATAYTCFSLWWYSNYCMCEQLIICNIYRSIMYPFTYMNFLILAIFSSLQQRIKLIFSENYLNKYFSSALFSCVVIILEEKFSGLRQISLKLKRDGNWYNTLILNKEKNRPKPVTNL